MQEYYFLFALATIATVFAVIQDLRTREVANWLNFSLVASSLAYLAFLSIRTKDYHPFVLGILGAIAFFLLATLMYYSKVFAGGDAKLMIGYGAIIPYSSYVAIPLTAGIFLFLLLTLGAAYSLIYSVGIVVKNSEEFSKEFRKQASKNRTLLIMSLVFLVIVIILATKNVIFFALTFLAIIPLTFIYTKSLEACMIRLTPPDKLTEGDWLERKVKIGKHTINPTVHGLSLQEIKLLKKYDRSVLIKNGIPFTPAFLLALAVTVYVVAILGRDLPSLLSSLLLLSPL